MARTYSILATLLAVCFLIVADGKKDYSQPHPHQGKLKAYEPGPFESIKLSPGDEKKLADGQPVMKQTMPDKDDPEAGGGAICVQDVAAPTAAVWNQILDLNSYKGKVPKVLTSKNYFERENDDGTKRIKTKMVLGVLPGYSVRLDCSLQRYMHPITHPLLLFSVPVLLRPHLLQGQGQLDLETGLRQDIGL